MILFSWTVLVSAGGTDLNFSSCGELAVLDRYDFSKPEFSKPEVVRVSVQ